MISSLKEFKLINHITSTLPNKYIGDDCACINDLSKLIISVDTFVEDVHFSFDYSKLNDVAIKTFNASFSDLAAMGGIAKYFLLSISAPNAKTIKTFINALDPLTRKLKVKIIGGDTTFSKKLIVSFTCIGQAKRPLFRSGAKVGDSVFLSSYSGLAGAGLICLKNKVNGFNILKEKHKRPKARFDLSSKVKDIANSMIDISDGLLSELYHIANDSNVDIVLENIPISKNLKDFEKKILLNINSNFKTAEELALFGGEDFELLYSVPEKFVSKALGFQIGKVVKKEAKNPKIIYKDKKLRLDKIQFKHF